MYRTDIRQTDNKIYSKGFFLLTLYLIIDYGRPQDVLPIGFLMPGMISILLLTAFLIFSGRIKETYSRQTTLIWLFILLLAAYIPFARNNYFAYKTAKNMLLFMPFILATIMCINTIERLKKIVVILLCLVAYMEIYGLLHRGVGSGNYFQDENDLSLFANMWLPFFYFLMIYEKKKVNKLLLFAGLVLGIAVNVISFSRGGFVGLLCVSFVIWVLSPKKVMSLMVIGLLGIVLIVAANNISSPREGNKKSNFWEEMSSISEIESGTAGSRIESWKAAWKMFLHNPLGVGGSNFIVHFPDYQSIYFERNMWGRAAHSLWFTLLAEMGILGVLIYGTLLKINLKDIRFLRNIGSTSDSNEQYIYYLSLAFIASFAAFFSSGSFLSVLYYPHYWYVTGLIVATRRLAGRRTVFNSAWQKGIIVSKI